MSHEHASTVWSRLRRRLGRPMGPGRAVTGRPHGTPAWRVTSLVVFAFAGGLFVTTSLNADGLDYRESSVSDTNSVLKQERARVNSLQSEVEQLGAEIEALSKRVGDSTVRDLQRQVDQLRGPAGYTPVHGPGLEVTLDDAPEEAVQKARDGDDDIPLDTFVIHQQDIQAVVNALWAGGAEAISIKDVRITATTGIKCVGNTVILYDVPYSPPYTIKAIGDPTQMRVSLAENEYVDGIVEASQLYDLGYDVEQADDLEIPGSAVAATMEHARRGASAPADRS